MMNPATPRPLYNRAKERLLQAADHQLHDLQLRPGAVLRVGKHFDYIWFEMQHSTMSYDEVRHMIWLPGLGAAPMIRMPDALSRAFRRPPTSALSGSSSHGRRRAGARDAARFSRYHRSGAAAPAAAPMRARTRQPELPRDDQRQHVVTVMIERWKAWPWPTSRGHARRRRHHPGQQRSFQLFRLEPERSALSGRDHQGARRGAEVRQVLRERRRQYLNGYTVSADTRMVQNGPACDGWRPARSRSWPRDRTGRGAGDRPGARRTGHGAGRSRAGPGSGVLLALM